MINETSLIKEQESRMSRAHENKENHRQGSWRQDASRPFLLDPPPDMAAGKLMKYFCGKIDEIFLWDN